MGPRSDERGNEELVNLYKRSIKYLQWGRAQMSAEIRRIGYVVRGRRCSSMGPRSDERGNALLQICLEAPLQSSMGPRSDERGNAAYQELQRKAAAILQWGRAQMSAEIESRAERRQHERESSMGPRSDERGNGSTELGSPMGSVSSMGPRSDERGNSSRRPKSEYRRIVFNGAALR